MDTMLNGADQEKILEILSAVERGESFLITTHRNIDGDAIGSELAFYHMLKKKGKNVSVINHDDTPAIYRFMPNSEDVRVFDEAKDAEMKADVAIVIDCGSETRMGRVSDLLKNAGTVINIDHHFSNSKFGNINWANHEFSSTGEMIYFILSYDGREIEKEEAECLYAAIITDTGNFVHNMGPYTMGVAQKLIASGAEPEEIARKIYFERPLKSLKLLAMSLKTLQFDSEKKACWMKVEQDMYLKTQTAEEDTEGFIDLLVKTKEADVVFLLKQSEGLIKASLRGKGDFDVERIASGFGGGGHKKAAGCYFEKSTIDEVEKKILSAIGQSRQSSEVIHKAAGK